MPRPLSLLLLALCLAAVTALADEPAITPRHSKTFSRYDNCEFVPTRYADGDSFRVRIGADEFVLRLYYVDAPESDERFPDRNAEQAHYFGITLEVGDVRWGTCPRWEFSECPPSFRQEILILCVSTSYLRQTAARRSARRLVPAQKGSRFLPRLVQNIRTRCPVHGPMRKGGQW